MLSRKTERLPEIFKAIIKRKYKVKVKKIIEWEKWAKPSLDKDVRMDVI